MNDINWLADNIFTVSDFLSPEECQNYIALGESHDFKAATINTIDGPILDDSIRNNERYTHDDFELAATMWKKAKDYVPKNFRGHTAQRFNERFQFYRYDVGQKFDWHYDGRYSPDAFTTSFFTFMIYLNDDFEGGSTSFVDSGGTDSFQDFSVRPETGMALFFDHHIKHKGDNITKGRKYVIRSDIMYVREF